MTLIKNFDELARSENRRLVLDIIEAGLAAIQPDNFIPAALSLKDSQLTVNGNQFDLDKYRSVRLLGFGKGSAAVAKFLEDLLGDGLTNGFVIDLTPQNFSKVKFYQGTHPLPSEANQTFTADALANLGGLTESDLCLVIICGGGSAMLTQPHSISIDKLVTLSQDLLHSEATIQEINVVRKHLSQVQGGGLAKKLYPATIVSLICSDVPGNDLSTIASGPLTKDFSTTEEALETLTKFNISQNDLATHFQETPKEDMYFKNVHQEIILSNLTALKAMKKLADDRGIKAKVLSDSLQADALAVGQILMEEGKDYSLILAGGETTLLITGQGQGGRNQELVLATLPYLSGNEIIASLDSDGWDNSPFAGAIGDASTLAKATQQGLDPRIFQKENNTQPFFDRVGDGIRTDRLGSNVSDLMIFYK